VERLNSQEQEAKLCSHSLPLSVTCPKSTHGIATPELPSADLKSIQVSVQQSLKHGKYRRLCSHVFCSTNFEVSCVHPTVGVSEEPFLFLAYSRDRTWREWVGNAGSNRDGAPTTHPAAPSRSVAPGHAVNAIWSKESRRWTF
jgi:hypothetical protein